jgi:hypothetical protein
LKKQRFVAAFMSESMAAKLKRESRRSDRSVSAVVRAAVGKYLSER